MQYKMFSPNNMTNDKNTFKNNCYFDKQNSLQQSNYFLNVNLKGELNFIQVSYFLSSSQQK